MLIVALILAVIGLAALVLAVVTSNELIAWACIAASAIGVVLLIVDALRDRGKADSGESAAAAEELNDEPEFVEDYPDEAPIADEYYDAPGGDAVAVDAEARDEALGRDRTDEQSPRN